MKWSFVSIGVLIFCIIGIMVVTFFNEITVSNEQDYYTLKEAAEASMYDAIDVAYYRLTGKIKISQEKFVENLTRRFTETSTFGQGNYDLIFYDISESPPKISVRVIDSTNSYNLFNTFSVDIGQTKLNIVNEISGILEIYSEGEKNDDVVVTPTSFVSKSNEEVEVIGKEEKDDIIEKLDEKKNSDTGIYKSYVYYSKIIDIIEDLIDEYEFMILYDGIIYVSLNSDVKEEDIIGNCEILDNKLLDCDGKTFVSYEIPEIVIDDVIVPVENVFEEIEIVNKSSKKYLNGIQYYENNYKNSKKDDKGLFGLINDNYQIYSKYDHYIVYDNDIYVSKNNRKASSFNSCYFEQNINDDKIINCDSVIYSEVDSKALCCIGAKKNDNFIDYYRVPFYSSSNHFSCYFENNHVSFKYHFSISNMEFDGLSENVESVFSCRLYLDNYFLYSDLIGDNILYENYNGLNMYSCYLTIAKKDVDVCG